LNESGRQRERKFERKKLGVRGITEEQFVGVGEPIPSSKQLFTISYS